MSHNTESFESSKNENGISTLNFLMILSLKQQLKLLPQVPIMMRKDHLVLSFENISQSQTEEVSPNVRRSSRPSKLPAKLNEFVLDSKVKYRLHRYVNHSLISGENYCFVTNLNKSAEASSFEEASKDINWINFMNEEMYALYENDTWELCDLPAGRKPIGSKWVYR
ncbi:ribonuclease H-like domain-containing protein, partial [Tanacetum coccineum]